MASLDVKNAAGERVGGVDVDASILESKITPRLLRDAYCMYEACQRQGTSAFKTKGLIAGSKTKLFRQKGTGRARMGQKRTPLRVGGGNAFGKLPKDWRHRLPKKALRVATRMALAGKLKDGEVIVVDQLILDKPKTKHVALMLKKLSVDGKKCLIVVGDYSQNTWLSTRNIPQVTLTTSAWLNSYDLLKNRYVLMTRDALDRCLGRFKA